MFMVAALATASVAMAGDRGSPGRLDDCSADEETSISTSNGATIDIAIDDTEGNCGRRPTDEFILQLFVNEDGLYTFDLEELDDDGYIYILTGCCDGDQLFPRGLVENYDRIRCMWLEEGTYYVVIEGYGDFVLSITSCEAPCLSVPFQEGFSYEGNQAIYVETVDAESSEPNYFGPWVTEGTPCQDISANPDRNQVGFGFYNWYNQDFGWSHYIDFSNFECEDYTIDSAYVVICAYENDFCDEYGPASEASYCQFDEVFINDNPAGILNPYTTPGSNLSVSETRFFVAPEALQQGVVGVFLDIDAMSDQCAWATEVWSSKLVVYMTCGQLPPEPVGYDLGDLPPFTDGQEPCYPTNTPESGGPANAVFAPEDQVAWLGECVSHELFPHVVNFDDCDDGIEFVPTNRPNGAWMPGDYVCVDVTISTGPAYVQGTPLFVWGWKDGNLDCDFDDIYEPVNNDDTVVIDECLIEGEPVFPSGPNATLTERFCFPDPGILDIGRYDGRFRFRLTSCGGQVPSREGELIDCITALTFVDEVLGETEDYILEDFQLPVELMSFTANGADGRVVLSWTTASETDNDMFEVNRWNGTAWQRAGARVDAAGTSPSQHFYQFVDSDVEPGVTYRYNLVAIDIDGNRMTVGEVESLVEPHSSVVSEFALHQNFPNPFNPSTQISYDLADATNVNLAVFDLLGRQVATLVNGAQNAGRYTVNFDASSLPSGMYFYRLETKNFTDMKKMMLLK
ncbi:MAG: T9SS type A sorting domain-containing protein [Calditrichaeota bacterium]|nr:T9SS type A sorting domain-containing protein [Calditrichota bacterium]MCB9367339.1 T9SS type A sorting domain-containing protein [Calditrichota bacterium]MCB9391305.1 T9SS type A sorting domain-containing protein [Calditrichota bacterium]